MVYQSLPHYFYGSDTITLTAKDLAGGFTTTQTIAVTVSSATVGVPTNIGSKGSNTASMSISVTLTSAVAMGNTVLLVASFDYTYTGAVSSVTDSRGNTYTSYADKERVTSPALAFAACFSQLLSPLR